jgi:hypothetical protein
MAPDTQTETWHYCRNGLVTEFPHPLRCFFSNCVRLQISLPLLRRYASRAQHIGKVLLNDETQLTDLPDTYDYAFIEQNSDVVNRCGHSSGSQCAVLTHMQLTFAQVTQA